MTSKAQSQNLSPSRPRLFSIKRIVLFSVALWCVLVLAYSAGYSQFFLYQNLIVPQSVVILAAIALFAPLIIIGFWFLGLSLLSRRPATPDRAYSEKAKTEFSKQPYTDKVHKNTIQEKEKAIQTHIESNLKKIQQNISPPIQHSRIFGRAVNDELADISFENTNPQAAPFLIVKSSPSPKIAIEPAVDRNFEKEEILIQDVLPYCDLSQSPDALPSELKKLCETGQKLVRLLSRDDIVLEDLRIDKIDVELWRKFALSRDGDDFSALAAVQDLSALSMANNMQRTEPEFRDLALSFQTDFIELLPRLTSQASHYDIEDFINSDIGRLFMILGKSSGVLVDKR